MTDMAPYSIANNTVVSTTIEHSFLQTSTPLSFHPLLVARTATPIGPSTRTAPPVQESSTKSSTTSTLGDDVHTAPRTYIGVGPVVVNNAPYFAYNNGTSPRVTAPPIPAKNGFIALVSVIFILFGIVGYLVWRRTRGVRQNTARPPIRPKQNRSETSRELAAGDDTPPSLASNLPRNIIRAMNAVPGPSTPSGDSTLKYPPTPATPDKPSSPPYAYFSDQLQPSLYSLPVIEITSPVSSAASSPGPLTPTFDFTPPISDSRASLDTADRYSWDFKCKGEHCSMNSVLSAVISRSNLATATSKNDTSSSGSMAREAFADSDQTTDAILRETVDANERKVFENDGVRDEAYVLAADVSRKDLDSISKSDPSDDSGGSENTPPSPDPAKPVEEECSRSEEPTSPNTTVSLTDHALLSALGLDGFDMKPYKRVSASASSSRIPDGPPKPEQVVTFESLSFDVDFEPFQIQVVQSRPPSLDVQKARHVSAGQAHHQNQWTDVAVLESRLQKVLSSPRGISSSAEMAVDVAQKDEDGKTKVCPVLSEPNGWTLSSTRSDPEMKSSASAPVLTPKLDLVATSQVSMSESVFEASSVENPVEYALRKACPPGRSSRNRKGLLRSSASVPSTTTVRNSRTNKSVKRHTVHKFDDSLPGHLVGIVSKHALMA